MEKSATVEDRQKWVTDYLPSSDAIELLASYFGAYSDPTRIKILSALSMSELCVSDISRLLDMNQTTVSHQLKLLRTLGMVRYKREGKIVFYSLANNTVNDIMLNGVEHITAKKF